METYQPPIKYPYQPEQQLPEGWEEAPLPEKYEAALMALAEADRIDECKGWADKMQALQSYARQAHDEELEYFATRIKARAVRRYGELLREFNAPGARTDQPREGDHPRSQKEAAEAAGLSEHQRKTAVRLASVSKEDFEEAVESSPPANITSIAAGTKSEPVSINYDKRAAKAEWENFLFRLERAIDGWNADKTFSLYMPPSKEQKRFEAAIQSLEQDRGVLRQKRKPKLV